MKKIVFICIIILNFWSCSVNDDSNTNNYYFEFIPIEDVTLPEVLKLDSIYQIDVTYYRPSTCHNFHDFYYLAEENERTVAVINIVSDNINCTPIESELVEKSFDFKAVYDQTYIFKFWQGEDDNGDDIYLTYEIPVVN